MPAAVRYGAVVAIGLGIRLALLEGKGFPTDIGAFAAWAFELATAGPHALYADVSGTVFPAVDYPPGYAFVLWLIGALAVHVFGVGNANTPLLHVLVKLPAVVADFALAEMLRRLALRYASERTAFTVFACALIAPPLWLVSAYWGQVDSFATSIFIVALYAMLERRFVVGWAIFAVAIMTKPQALVALPALAVWEFRERGMTFGLVKAAAAGLAVAYSLSLPFAPVLDPLGVLRWIFVRYGAGVAKYPNGSTGAFNLYGIGNGFYESDAQRFAGIPLHTWGTALVCVALAAIGVRLWKVLGNESDARQRERAMLFATFLSLAALFMLATRMHERYLMPALAAGVVVATFDRRAVAGEAILATIFTINCAFILAGFAGGKHHPITLVIGHLLSLLGLATFLALGALFFTKRAPAVAVKIASA